MTEKPNANWAEMMRVLLLAAQALDSLEGRSGLARADRQGMGFIEEQTKRAERAEARVEALWLAGHNFLGCVHHARECAGWKGQACDCGLSASLAMFIAALAAARGKAPEPSSDGG